MRDNQQLNEPEVRNVGGFAIGVEVDVVKSVRRGEVASRNSGGGVVMC